MFLQICLHLHDTRRRAALVAYDISFRVDAKRIAGLMSCCSQIYNLRWCQIIRTERVNKFTEMLNKAITKFIVRRRRYSHDSPVEITCLQETGLTATAQAATAEITRKSTYLATYRSNCQFNL